MLIKDIPNIERPRERLKHYGIESLSNEELISIIIGTGTKNSSCKDLSLMIMNEIKDISNLKDMNPNNLTKIKGVGTSKASSILASVELGKRVYQTKVNNIVLNTPEKIYSYVKDLFTDKKQEYFYTLYLDNKNHLLEKKLLFIGTVNKSIVHPREIFKYAYIFSASSIIIVHNHPSGDSNPSKEDIILTENIIEIGTINKIPLIDHLIIGNDSYYSFNDNGYI
jgi:DNA repair protein RadC